MTPIADEIKQTKPFKSKSEEALLSIVRTADLMNLALERMMKEHGVTPTQYNVLRILRGALPDGLPCTEIGRRLVTHVPDVTRLLDRIEKQGWVRRERTKSDRRLVIISLTEQGKSLVDSLDEPVSHMDTKLVSGLDDQELAELIALLDKVRAGVE